MTVALQRQIQLCQSLDVGIQAAVQSLGGIFLPFLWQKVSGSASAFLASELGAQQASWVAV